VLAIVARVWTTLVEVVPAGLFWIGHLMRAQGEQDAAEERAP
jgi:hypothetical protein